MPHFELSCIPIQRSRFFSKQGGWISEQGRLRSDPRIIVKVKPATTPPLPPARPSPTQSPLGSSQRRGDTQAGVRQGGGGAIRPSISQEQHLARHRQGQPERRTRAEEEPGSIRRTTQSGSANQAWKMKESAQHTQRERHHDHGKPQLHRHPVTTAAGALRRVQTLSAGSPEVSQTRGGFGRATSLSPEVLDEHGSATGDKVKCPMCHRGMDHWQPKQRQQVGDGRPAVSTTTVLYSSGTVVYGSYVIVPRHGVLMNTATTRLRADRRHVRGCFYGCRVVAPEPWAYC